MFEHFYIRKIDVDFNNLLKPWIGKANLSFLEIGSAEGSSAIGTIKEVLTDKSSTLTCLDNWNPIPLNGAFEDDYETNFDTNTQPYADQIVKVKSNSTVWLSNNQDKKFDFIYIDGDHSYQGCKSDLELSWNLLKNGCWMVADCYSFDGVGTAVVDFIESVKNNVTFVKTEAQMWLQKVE
jgi:predicted O-methyltransferase YrrM